MFQKVRDMSHAFYLKRAEENKEYTMRTTVKFNEKFRGQLKLLNWIQ